MLSVVISSEGGCAKVVRMSTDGRGGEGKKNLHRSGGGSM